ncbi:AraC family transcriptional regulator [Paenibacillus sp. CC-CFT747]|nr:AraC family transcriptional regulator [Paenibacillus sp. CC-CFT747]
MKVNPHALDRLDLKFRWGGYGFRVLRCHWTSFSPGKVVGFHKHSEFEFHFIPRGKGLLSLEDGDYEVSEGMFYLTGPQVVHQQTADAEEGMDELCLHIDIVDLKEAPEGDQWGGSWEDAEAEQCVKRLEEMPAVPALDRFNAMSWFLTAYRSWSENQLGQYSSIKQAIIQILLRASRTYSTDSLPTPLPARNMNHYRFTLAAQYIQDNYSRSLTLEEVAARLSISGRHLQRIFLDQAGVSFSEYVENCRLAQVCTELKQGTRTIEQIAGRHGFSSPNYLHYVFKKRMGVTLMQFRRQAEEHSLKARPT